MLGLLINLLLLPFHLCWFLVGLVFTLFGKLLTAGLGLILMIIGLVLCVTIIASPVGIIMLIFGFLMCLKGIF